MEQKNLMNKKMRELDERLEKERKKIEELESERKQTLKNLKQKIKKKNHTFADDFFKHFTYEQMELLWKYPDETAELVLENLPEKPVEQTDTANAPQEASAYEYKPEGTSSDL